MALSFIKIFVKGSASFYHPINLMTYATKISQIPIEINDICHISTI